MAKTLGKESTQKILLCICDSKFQDEEYGTGKRLMNPTKKLVKSELQATTFRCTVCKREVKG